MLSQVLRNVRAAARSARVSNKISSRPQQSKRGIATVGPIAESFLKNPNLKAEIEKVEAMKADFATDQAEILTELQEAGEDMVGPHRAVFEQAAKLLNSLNLGDSASGSTAVTNMDEILQVRGAQATYEVYCKIAPAIVASWEPTLPVDVEEEKLAAMAYAETRHKYDALSKAEARIDAECEDIDREIKNLLYLQSDDILAAHPEWDAQLEEEIKENRWDLLAKEYE